MAQERRRSCQKARGVTCPLPFNRPTASHQEIPGAGSTSPTPSLRSPDNLGRLAISAWSVNIYPGANPVATRVREYGKTPRFMYCLRVPLQSSADFHCMPTSILIHQALSYLCSAIIPARAIRNRAGFAPSSSSNFKTVSTSESGEFAVHHPSTLSGRLIRSRAPSQKPRAGYCSGVERRSTPTSDLQTFSRPKSFILRRNIHRQPCLCV
ncbi:hypothetical protein V2W45_767602 [Cenococcum geophilum]